MQNVKDRRYFGMFGVFRIEVFDPQAAPGRKSRQTAGGGSGHQVGAGKIPKAQDHQQSIRGKKQVMLEVCVQAGAPCHEPHGKDGRAIESHNTSREKRDDVPVALDASFGQNGPAMVSQ